jgi:phytoene dehydrogenase-like protein
VVVHEAAPQVGGGLQSQELTLPGFVHDVCSAVHPLALASPLFGRLELDVEWVQPELPAAHPLDGEPAVLLRRAVDETAAGLGADAAAYRETFAPLVAGWSAIQDVLVGSYPVSPRRALRLVRELSPAGALAAARASLAAARPFAESRFAGRRARASFAGHCAHSMLPLERRPSAGFGLALVALGHAIGWPFPRGGAQRIADALVALLRELGGEVEAASPVDSLDGLPRTRSVFFDVGPEELVRVAGDRLPRDYVRRLRHFRRGPAAFKVDYALGGPIPWTAEACARAGTVHLGGTLPEIAESERAPWRGEHAERPFVLLAQHSLFDPSRAPEGKHTVWAYCHVPNGSDVDMTERIEAQIERFAPGFRERVLERSVLPPAALEARNRNLVGGDINGGAATLWRLAARPVTKLDPYATPARGVYLCSASTPPGGGVHGMCGFLAARSALEQGL